MSGEILLNFMLRCLHDS